MCARRTGGVRFRPSLFLDLLSIAAGDFIAEQVSEAHAISALAMVSSCRQMEGRGMVIDDEGYAVLGTIQAGNKSAGLDHVVIELFVHAPPDVFEHLKEVRQHLWVQEAYRVRASRYGGARSRRRT